MGQGFVQVDAFTDRPFAGNPAAVLVLAEARDDGWMQAVARELNLSETAFLAPGEDGFGLRWFTPGQEVDLCGHATLASAHVLWEGGLLAAGEEARFHTRSGLLTARQSGGESGRGAGWIEMDFPAEPAREVPSPEGLALALGAGPLWVGQNRLDYLVELEDEEAVRALRPDHRELAAMGGRGFIVTARAHSSVGGEYDFVSRYFAPAVGIDEDPVTGSAHCALGPFWRERLGRAAGEELVGRQASPRGGTVRVRPLGDRVLLRGQAVTILRGEILI